MTIFDIRGSSVPMRVVVDMVLDDVVMYVEGECSVSVVLAIFPCDLGR